MRKTAALRDFGPAYDSFGSHSRRFDDVRVASAYAPKPATKRTSQDFALVAKLRRDGPVRAVAGFEFRNSR
jgi:hypothetical protein